MKKRNMKDLVFSENLNEIPCKPNCPDRNAECHAACPKYAAYAKLCEIRRNARYDEYRADKKTTNSLKVAWNEYAAVKHCRNKRKGGI